MEGNTIVRTIEMSDETYVKTGAEKMTIKISSTTSPCEGIIYSGTRVTDVAFDEAQYAIARLKAILTDRGVSENEEIFVALTVSVRTKQ